MRIIQVVHSFYPEVGGIEQHVYHLSKELVKQGHDVVVYTTGKGKENLDGVEVKRFWALSLPLFSSVNCSPGLVLSLLGEKGDVFASHGYGPTIPHVTAWISWFKRRPFIFTLHGYPQLRGLDGLFQFLYKWTFAFWFLRIAKKIILVSKATKKQISKEADPNKLVYIANGIGNRFFSGIGNKRNVIAYIGRFDRYKRIDMLIDAFAELKKQFPGLQLWLIGKDEGIRNELEKQIAELKLRDVKFKQVKPAEMPSIYRQVKAVVLPSRYEGFSLVWLEAMASQAAMFSTPVGEASGLFAEVYGKNANKFLFKDKDKLVEKLGAFLRQEKQFGQVLTTAQKRIKQKYTWEAVAKKTLEVFKAVL